MKQLRNNGFKKVINHLEKLPFIEWEEKYCEINEAYKDNVEFTIDKYIFSFDWLIHKADWLTISSIMVHNNNKGFEYDTSNEQWCELKKQIESLFNFEK